MKRGQENRWQTKSFQILHNWKILANKMLLSSSVKMTLMSYCWVFTFKSAVGRRSIKCKPVMAKLNIFLFFFPWRAAIWKYWAELAAVTFSMSQEGQYGTNFVILWVIDETCWSSFWFIWYYPHYGFIWHEGSIFLNITLLLNRQKDILFIWLPSDFWHKNLSIILWYENQCQLKGLLTEHHDVVTYELITQ